MSDKRVYVCGGTPTPEARAELEAFGVHLLDHRDAPVATCRFCREREAKTKAKTKAP